MYGRHITQGKGHREGRGSKEGGISITQSIQAQSAEADKELHIYDIISLKIFRPQLFR